MARQRSTFLLPVYGCIDTASRKVNLLRIWTDNCDPKITARWYFDYLFEKRIVQAKLRIDRGSEIGNMATIHTFLRSDHGDLEDTLERVIFAKTTVNQVKRWLKELHDRFEKYFKEQLVNLLEQGHYDLQNEIHRNIIAYVYVLVLEREMHLFVTNWNNGRIRFQKDTILPVGVTVHIYSFPEKYNLEKCDLSISKKQLQHVLELSEFLRISNEYLENDFNNRSAELRTTWRLRCKRLCKCVFISKTRFICLNIEILGRRKLIISIAFHLDKVNAICRFYFLFLDISKPNAEIFTGFFTA